MATYKIEFSYLSRGERRHDSDLFDGDNLKDAAHQAERCYGGLTNFYIERIYKEVPAHWIEMATDFLD